MSDQPSTPDQPQPRRPKIDVRVPDDQKQGTYANLLVVTHGAHEFTLDFAQFQPSTDGTVSAEVVQRIRIAPTLVGQVMQALNANLSKYEDRFGPVKAIG